MEPKNSIRLRLLIVATVIFIPVVVFLIANTRFDIKGHREGIFLLKARRGALFEIKDDLYLGDGSRLIIGLDTDITLPGFLNKSVNRRPGEPYMEFEWDRNDGSGFVRNHLADGTELLTCLSRFANDEGLYYHGIFVGGGLPANVRGGSTDLINETGMSYNDGTRWCHLWCNANEGLASASTLNKCDPSQWQFLGSWILNRSSFSLALKSSHKALIDGVPLRIDRYAYFRAGDTYFILSILIRNIGNDPVSFYYAYGDEPWLGDYGSSKGNVGWADGHIITTVQYVDTLRYGHAGFFDYGNAAAGEGHNFTRKANFIKWYGRNVPLVYFSNGPLEFPDINNEGKPLASDERFIGLQWGPQVLKPGKKVRYSLAIGMAAKDRNGFPVLPEIKLDHVPK